MIFRKLNKEKYEKAMAFMDEMEDKLDRRKDYHMYMNFKNVQLIVLFQDKKRFPLQSTDIITVLSLVEGFKFIDTL